MNSFFSVLTAVALILAMGMGAGPVAAQENVTENATENATDELEDELAEDLNGTAVDTLDNQEIIRFNDETRIVGWEFRDGTITVAVHSDRRTGVTVSDALAGIGQDGAVQVPETNKFVERDEVTTVRMNATTYQGGNSVSVTVDGLTVRLSTEMDGSSGDNPLRYFGGESGLFAGMGIAVGMSGAATVFVLWREENGVIKA